MVSNVGDYWGRRAPWEDVWPGVVPFPEPQKPAPDFSNIIEAQKLRKELEIAKAEIAALENLCKKMAEELEEAKRQDIESGTPDCSQEAKTQIIKLLAEVFGVDVSKVFQ